MDRWKKLLGVDDVLRSERPRLFKVIAAEVFDVICGLLEKEEYQESIIRLGEIGFEKLVKLCARYGDETEDLRGFILQKLEECSGGERAQSGSMDPGAVRMRIRENLEYDWFVEMYRTAPRSERPAGSVEQLDSIVEIIVEVLCSDQKMIRVSGAQMPRELVCQRLMSLNSEHIIYVMDCLEKNPSEIRNIKAYLLTVLYNAPATMDSYYSALLRSNRGKSRE